MFAGTLPQFRGSLQSSWETQICTYEQGLNSIVHVAATPHDSSSSVHVERKSCDFADSSVPHTPSCYFLSRSLPWVTNSPLPLHVRLDPVALDKTAFLHDLARCADHSKACQNSGGGANNSDSIQWFGRNRC